MKTYKTIELKTTLYTGKYKDNVSNILNQEASQGWSLSTALTQIRGLMFKKILTTLIFVKEN
jgi:hypothetical protein